MSFSDDFIWGAATASYQIEGAAYEGGKGLSVWDMLCRKQGAVYNGNNGDVACDHYHRFKEDVAIMKEIGIKAYRMSISWPRILPDGTGKVNPEGIRFYNSLFDELLKNGITPFVTLFHWDYPYQLFLKGGWLNPQSPMWFAEYVKTAAYNFSDRVCNWMTFNEPQVFVGLGHLDGIHAPGLQYNIHEMLTAVHNVLLSHGRAVGVLRESAKKHPSVGIAPVGVTTIPATESDADIEAARKAMFSLTNPRDWNVNTLWCDPIFFGSYPQDGIEMYGEAFVKVKEGDMDIIRQPLDFLGVNIYHGKEVKAGEDGQPRILPLSDGYPLTAFPWPLTPKALYWGPKFFYERYGKNIFITENGLANIDWVSVDGKVHDPQRIDFTARYLKQLKKACDEKIPVKGYFHWSLMDNFEWAEGYSKRFGMVYVDYRTQKRTVKDSGYWYNTVIKTNGREL